MRSEDDGGVLLPQRLQPLPHLAGKALVVQRQPTFVDDQQRRPAVEAVFDAKRFEDTRKAVYAAGLAGGSYPVNSGEWFSQSTAAIDEVIALSVLASQEAARLAEAAQRSSLLTLVLNAVLMAFSLLLAAATLWMVISRVVRSLGQMTEAMSEIASGETSAVVPCSNRRDEMGSMARALLVFKENVVKVRNMQAERGSRRSRPAGKDCSDGSACRCI